MKLKTAQNLVQQLPRNLTVTGWKASDQIQIVFILLGFILSLFVMIFIVWVWGHFRYIKIQCDSEA